MAEAEKTTPLDRLAAEAVVLAGGDHPYHILGHLWKFVGAAGCGCKEIWDQCSMPVHECTACGDCDYGDNPAARKIRECCEYAVA